MGADLGPPLGAEQRRAFREFVKTHHPDAGGDPEVFLAGLRTWQHEPAGQGAAPANVVFYRTPRGAARLLRWLPPRRRHRRLQ
jgi:hypothetical protein